MKPLSSSQRTGRKAETSLSFIPEKTTALPVIFLSIGITGVILYTVMTWFRLFPFGDVNQQNTLAWGDMKQQVIPLMLTAKDIFSGNGNLFLNLQNAGGMNFWGVFFFFLSSPFSLLVLFTEKTDLYYLVNLMVVLKLLCASGTAAFFFGHCHDHGDLYHPYGSLRPNRILEIHRRQTLLAVGFSVSYALCGFGLLYYQNLLWLDLLYLFPLTMYSFRKLLLQRKPLCFCLCLIATISLSYYLSSMVLLFLLLAAAVFVSAVPHSETRREISAQIGQSAFTALGVTAVIWLPSLLQYLRSARTDAILSDQRFWTPLFTTLPMLLCTGGLSALPFCFRRFRKTRDSWHMILRRLFLLLLIPLFIEPIHKFWHLGSYQAFPLRYGYILVFVGLWLLWMLLTHPAHLSDQHRSAGNISLAPGLLVTFLALLTGGYLLFRHRKELTGYLRSLWFDAQSFLHLLPFFFLSALGFLLLFFAWYAAPQRQGILSVILLALTMGAGLFYGSIFIGAAANDPGEAIRYLQNPAADLPENARVKTKTKKNPVNLTGALGYPTIDHYSSLTDRRFFKAMGRLGYSEYWMETASIGGTFVSDTLLGNQYELQEDGSLQPTGVPTGIGFLCVTNTKELFPQDVSKQRLQAQEQLFHCLTGTSGFHFYEPQSVPVSSPSGLLSPGETLVYRLFIGKPETLYFDFSQEIGHQIRQESDDSIRITVNGSLLENAYPNSKNNGILKLGSFQQKSLRIEIEVLKPVNPDKLTLAGLPEEKAALLRDAISPAAFSRQGNTLSFRTDTRAGKNELALPAASLPKPLKPSPGSIQATDPTETGYRLFLSIPVQPGISFTLNGYRIQPKQVLDCFYEIPLYPGVNEICLQSIPQGFSEGLILSCGTLLLVSLLFLIRQKKIYLLYRQVIGYCAYPVLMLTAVLGFLGVYLLPLVLYLTKWFASS